MQFLCVRFGDSSNLEKVLRLSFLFDLKGAIAGDGIFTQTLGCESLVISMMFKFAIRKPLLVGVFESRYSQSQFGDDKTSLEF